MITISGVSKSYGAQKAVDDISLEIEEKEILVLLGTSGCGKTTTLKMINRLIEPDHGTILINGKNIKDQKPEVLRKTIGFVMQHAGLFPHYTVAKNIGVLPGLLNWNAKKTQSRTAELLEKLNLPLDIAERYPHQLSGGQQQRVGIARALIANTPILLMDEPFGALDTITKAAIHKEFTSLDELTNKTTVLVTHDVQEAFELGNRICLMDKGKIVQIGTPNELLYHPLNNLVKDFFADNRLILEYKTASLKAVMPYLKMSLSLKGDTDDLTVWQAIQLLNADSYDLQSYEALMEAFNRYRKIQLL